MTRLLLDRRGLRPDGALRGRRDAARRGGGVSPGAWTPARAFGAQFIAELGPEFATPFVAARTSRAERTPVTFSPGAAVSPRQKARDRTLSPPVSPWEGRRVQRRPLFCAAARTGRARIAARCDASPSPLAALACRSSGLGRAARPSRPARRSPTGRPARATGPGRPAICPARARSNPTPSGSARRTPRSATAARPCGGRNDDRRRRGAVRQALADRRERADDPASRSRACGSATWCSEPGAIRSTRFPASATGR